MSYNKAFFFTIILSTVAGGITMALATRAIPRMMSGMMQNMMSKMMGDSQGTDIPKMPQMMEEMMPHCLGAMLPQLAKERRLDFVLKMVTVLVEKGSTEMSDEEKKDFVEKIIENITT